MKRRLSLTSALLLAGVTTLLAHDMFLKLERYFLAEEAPLTIPLLNGTFSTSENAIDRDRIADISLVSPAGTTRLDTTQVTARGDSTFVATRTGAAGTYVFGVSTRPRVLRMSGETFHAYLTEEGLTEVLERRKQAGAGADSVSERYAKHVKAVFQVGSARSGEYATVLGYPAELVPLENPYDLRASASLRLRVLVGGRLAPGLTVIAGGRDGQARRLPVQTVRSGADGVATIRLSRAGVYYAKFIAIALVGGGADYESNWATITFAVR